MRGTDLRFALRRRYLALHPDGGRPRRATEPALLRDHTAGVFKPVERRTRESLPDLCQVSRDSHRSQCLSQ
jgi:hypothetical protein